MKYFDLKDGCKIPALGFGTWKLKGAECQKAVENAVEVGFRHIDTADAYENHREVGEAIKTFNLKREEFFITTKVWRTNLHEKDVISSCERFLEELKLDYVDLLLVHWPNKEVNIKETLEGFSTLKERKLIKSIGVSNFTAHHLCDALGTGVNVVNNQVEFHPSFYNLNLKKFCDEKNIIITAYSPLGQGFDVSLPKIKEISEKHNKSCAQVVLNWIISKNVVAIPKSTNPEYIKDNFESLDWELTPSEILEIDLLNTNKRLLDPEFSEFNY